MKLGKDLDYLLMCVTITEKDDFPFLDNFMASTSGATDDRDFWSFLWFLRDELKKYRLANTIISFQEFLNNKYPPLEKNRPRAKRRRPKSI